MTSTHTGEPDKEDLLCIHCKETIVEIVKEHYPWSEEYWICPKCDSTYCLWVYPMTDTDYHAYTQTEDGNL